MSVNIVPISSEEQDQILQTIEMFEVIIQASPNDSQSMEILKDAYIKVGKLQDGLAISRRLGDLYMELGQFSQALFEYEFIVQKDPGNPEVIAALSELEERMNKAGQGGASPEQSRAAGSRSSLAPADGMSLGGGSGIPSYDLDFILGDGGTLITTEATIRTDGVGGPRLITAEEMAAADDGNEALAKFLVNHRIVSEEIVTSAFERVSKKNRERHGGTLPISLIDEICRRGSIELEHVLSGIIDRSKFAFIPLEYYDVDRSVVRMLPEHLTVGRLMVPFDVMSRTVMIATANPFDAAAKEAAQQLLDYNIQWHLASPQAIGEVLASSFKVGPAKTDSIPFRLAS